MTDTTTVSRTATTDAPILDVLAERWSPRSFELVPIDEAKLASALEAARWSPSASNSQPWQFIVGRRGTKTFDSIIQNLMGFNQAWAAKASVLIVAVAELADSEGKTRPWAVYDLGQAVAHLSIQAQSDGLHVHQMGGIKAQGLAEAFGLAENWVPQTVAALGVLAPAESLGDEAAIARETAPRTRKPLDEIVVVND